MEGIRESDALSLISWKEVLSGLFPRNQKMHFVQKNAQLAVRKLLFHRPLARGDCAVAQSIFAMAKYRVEG